jgi:hypothetical protein
VSEATVLRRLARIEASLAAEVQSAAFLGSFFPLRERMNRTEQNKKRKNKIIIL